MTCRLCFTNDDDNHYRGPLLEIHTNAFVSTRILIILRDFMPNLMIICLNSLNKAETTITISEVQNYQFAPEGNMLGLTFKITMRLYLCEFHECTIYFKIERLFTHKIMTFH